MRSRSDPGLVLNMFPLPINQDEDQNGLFQLLKRKPQNELSFLVKHQTNHNSQRPHISGDKKCDATQKSPLLLEFVSPVDKRRKVKRKTSSVTTQGKKSQRKGGQSPFFTAFAEMFKSEHQQHKKKKGTKSYAVQKSSLLLEFVSPVEERRSSSGPNRAKMSPQVSSDWTHVNDAVLEIPKFNAEPSPSGERRMVTRSATRKNRTGGLVCVCDDDFFMVGAGWQKPSDAKDKKTIGTSDAHPDEPRSAVQPVPADEMPDGVDQPADLPDPNYRSLEQKLS
ncbi:uncharacterized protein LOC128219310 [Mya arenaria]|uniref:uncharacterized protein LOC128219310 n=1 Tax=Mya arenaria TaxID=6604 RepID=UPI0022E8482E|nr:uncharacterized protein LOC128219310 [Mya arenaria]